MIDEEMMCVCVRESERERGTVKASEREKKKRQTEKYLQERNRMKGCEKEN